MPNFSKLLVKLQPILLYREPASNNCAPTPEEDFLE